MFFKVIRSNLNHSWAGGDSGTGYVYYLFIIVLLLFIASAYEYLDVPDLKQTCKDASLASRIYHLYLVAQHLLWHTHANPARLWACLAWTTTANPRASWFHLWPRNRVFSSHPFGKSRTRTDPSEGAAGQTTTNCKWWRANDGVQ